MTPAERERMYYTERKAAGLCVRRGCANLAVPGETRCAYHSETEAEKRRDKRAEVGHCSNCGKPHQTELRVNGNPYNTCPTCRARDKARRLRRLAAAA